jgi:mersacidin/lichenicidin family type 2 lantibiotic
MNVSKIVKAWKDDEYRQGLSAAELAMLPENPAGLLELTDEDLGEVAGGRRRKRSRSRSRRRSRSKKSRS